MGYENPGAVNFVKFWNIVVRSGISVALFLRNFQDLWAIPFMFKVWSVSLKDEVSPRRVHFPEHFYGTAVEKLLIGFKKVKEVQIWHGPPISP